MSSFGVNYILPFHSYIYGVAISIFHETFLGLGLSCAPLSFSLSFSAFWSLNKWNVSPLFPHPLIVPSLQWFLIGIGIFSSFVAEQAIRFGVAFWICFCHKCISYYQVRCSQPAIIVERTSMAGHTGSSDNEHFNWGSNFVWGLSTWKPRLRNHFNLLI